MKKTEIIDHQNSAIEAAATINDWVTIDAFCGLFPNIPKKTLRWQLTSRQRNGLDPHIQIIGKQRYISIRGYAKWLDYQGSRTDQNELVVSGDTI